VTIGVVSWLRMYRATFMSMGERQFPCRLSCVLSGYLRRPNRIPGKDDRDSYANPRAHPALL